ncbi:MAG: hypothetical protein ACE5MI_07170 [Acidimicrobiia bacterium]
MRPSTWMSALVLLLVVLAACSSQPPTGDLTPLAACAEDAPDCDDTVVVGDDDLFVEDEPDDGVRPGSSGGFLVEGGLTVSEALETDATGILAVHGFYFSTSEGTWLCELLAESLPPLCGGERLALGDTTGIDLGILTTAQAVTWSDHLVAVFGEISDGTLLPNAQVTG